MPSLLEQDMNYDLLTIPENQNLLKKTPSS